MNTSADAQSPVAECARRFAPGWKHVLPFPFASTRATSPSLQSLARALDHQRSLFARLPGRGALTFAPIDFTQAGDSFDPADYGREALIETLLASAPAAAAV